MDRYIMPLFMKKRLALLALAAAVLLWGGAACAAGQRLEIVTTIFPAYDFARAVAGDKAGISMLVRPGSEVHDFDPSPRDMLSIRGADVFIRIGGESEAWAETLLKPSDFQGRTVRLMDHVNAIEDEEEGVLDEHIWTSPRNAARLIIAVMYSLCDADPTNAGEYKYRAAQYLSEISDLGGEFNALFASAKRDKVVLADRFPFRYFADEFGLEFHTAFPGCHVEGDVSAAAMAHLIKTVEDEKIPAVYALELSNGGIARAIAEQTGAEVLMLHSCQNVTKSEFESGATYLSLMRQNLENLKKGLN